MIRYRALLASNRSTDGTFANANVEGLPAQIKRRPKGLIVE
jgi:hypothetical protein